MHFPFTMFSPVSQTEHTDLTEHPCITVLHAKFCLLFLRTLTHTDFMGMTATRAFTV